MHLDQGFGTPVPTWNHLWFVAYLPLVALFAPRPSAVDDVAAPPGRVAMMALLIGPWLCLWVLWMTLFPEFGSNHAMVRDVYRHALHFAMFVFGFALVGRPGLWLMIDRLHWPALVLAVQGTVVFIATSLAWGRALPHGQWVRRVSRAGREAQAWGAVLAALGFARRHLNRDHRWRVTLADADFACYIVHQTALITLAVWLKPLQLGGALDAAGVVAGTVLACALSAEVARRVRWLRPLFGFRSLPPGSELALRPGS